MSRITRAKTDLPQSSLDSLVALGKNITTSRLRQRISQANLATQMGINVETLGRLENGEASVSVGVIARALSVLGFEPAFGELAEPARDTVALQAEISRLPTSIRTKSTGPRPNLKKFEKKPKEPATAEENWDG